MAISKRTGIIAGGAAMLTAGTVAMFMLLSSNVIEVGPGDDLQAALNSAKFGDTIHLAAGATFKTSVGFNLGDKGTPTSTARDCGDERILLTTSDSTGTPPALSNYPAQKVVITTAMAARMPKVVTTSGSPAIWVNPKAKCWVVEGLDITSEIGSNTVRLVGLGEREPTDISEWPDRDKIRLNWIHPPEETGVPATQETLNRSAENAIYMEGTRIDIEQNAIQGFLRRYPDGTRAASAGVLMSTWSDDISISRNLIQAWTYSWFLGGGAKGIASADGMGTVSSCTSLSCVFSSTKGITIGKAVAIRVYTYVDGNGITREAWGTMRVAGIDGSTVKFEAPLCWSGNDVPNDNQCLPFKSTAPQQIPSDGSPTRWDGYQIQNVNVIHNIIEHPREWGPLMGNNCGGKGYYELKSAKNVKIEGNIFEGCTGPTITTRNQAGADPWNDNDGLSVSFNWYKDGNAPFTGYFNDGRNLTDKSKNIRYHNNLVERLYVNDDSNAYFQVIANQMSGGDNISVTHNTVLVGKYRAFTSYADKPNRLEGFVNRDNIYLAAPNICFTDSAGIAGAPITACWPGAEVRRNGLIKVPDWTDEDIKTSWTTPYPDNILVASLAAAGFTNPDLSGTSLDNYRLLSTSPFYKQGSDSTDLGADIDALKSAIFGSGSVSLPSPTASATATATSTPTPTVTPTPTPTPQPSPSPTPCPSLSVLSRAEIIAKANIRSGPTISAPSIGTAKINARGWTTGTRTKDPASDFWYIFIGFDDGRSGYVADVLVRNR